MALHKTRKQLGMMSEKEHTQKYHGDTVAIHDTRKGTLKYAKRGDPDTYAPLKHKALTKKMGKGDTDAADRKMKD